MTAKVQIRRFNSDGVAFFAELLRDAPLAKASYSKGRSRCLGDEVFGYLSDPALSEPIETALTIDRELRFQTQYDFVFYLSRRFGSKAATKPWLEDIGAMNWLAFAFLHVITERCPQGMLIGERSRYLLDNRMEARHLVRTPLSLYAHHGSDVEFVLKSARPYSLNDLTERYLYSDNIRSFPAALKLGNRLFRSMSAEGVPNAELRAFGARLARVISQFVRNYDVLNVTEEELARILAREPTLTAVMECHYRQVSRMGTFTMDMA